MKPSNKPNYKIQLVTDDATLEKIYRLRAEVWLSEGAKPTDSHIWRRENNHWIIKDKYDDDAYHWAVIVNDDVVAAARLTIHNSLSDIPSAELFQGLDITDAKIACFNRLVVGTEYQGKGLSKTLDSLRHQMAVLKKCSYILSYTSATQKRLKSFIKQGFKLNSPINGAKGPFGSATTLVKKLA